jgi:hypothetical protein
LMLLNAGVGSRNHEPPNRRPADHIGLGGNVGGVVANLPGAAEALELRLCTRFDGL